MTPLVRRAQRGDARQACEVVRRSIVDLCTLDHGHDAKTIEDWLANKTEANFDRWIASDQNVAVVAENEGTILGFGLLKCNGILALLYVSPAARFQGVSESMLSWLEREASKIGLDRISLESSVTAERFYRSRGYRPSGPPVSGFGLTQACPMVKNIAA